MFSFRVKVVMQCKIFMTNIDLFSFIKYIYLQMFCNGFIIVELRHKRYDLFEKMPVRRAVCVFDSLRSFHDISLHFLFSFLKVFVVFLVTRINFSFPPPASTFKDFVLLAFSFIILT